METNNLSYRITHHDNGVTVYLTGEINESSDLSVFNDLKGPIEFNFRNITAISSYGIRNWTNLIRAISSEVFYSECSPPVVRQMNRIPSFIGKAHILSVYVVYYCDECDEEKIILVSRDQFMRSSLTVPQALECPRCNTKTMLIGDMDFVGCVRISSRSLTDEPKDATKALSTYFDFTKWKD